MLKSILLGLSVLSNIATLVGLWITYISVPFTVQSRIAHALLVGGAVSSVLLYLLIVRLLLKPNSEPLNTAFSRNSGNLRGIDNVSHLAAKGKLVIHSANYRAYGGEGQNFQVADFLRQIIDKESLVFDVENHNFVVNGQNFVPRDPLPGQTKFLRVTYSYDGGLATTTERPEHSRLILPEDSEIIRLRNELERQKSVIPEWKEKYLSENLEKTNFQKELARVQNELDDLKKSDTSLRARTIAMCDELKEFLAECGPKPEVDPRKVGEDPEGYLSRTWHLQQDFSARMGAKFRLRFNGSARRLTDEIYTRLNCFSELPLTQALVKAESQQCEPKDVQELLQQLWNLALRLDK